jgi:hypothetical protein
VRAKGFRIQMNRISERRSFEHDFCDAERGKCRGLSYKGMVKTCHKSHKYNALDELLDR